MSITNWKRHIKVWLCDKNRKPIGRIDTDLVSPAYRLGIRAQGEFSFEIDIKSRYATDIKSADDEEQYIVIQRRGKLFGYLIEHVARVYRVQGGKVRQRLEVSGRYIGIMLWFPIMQPESGSATVAFTGTIDDAIKDHVRYQMVVGTAYADPDATPRGYAGFTVAANKTEHATSATFTRAGACLGDEIEKWAIKYGIDYDVQTTFAAAAVTWEFETFLNGRGSDKTTGNTDGNVPVVLSDIYEVVKDGDWFIDRYGYRNVGYVEGLNAVVARGGTANFMRRELVVQTAGTVTVDLALQEADQSFGYTFGFMESEGVQVDRDVWLYDKVTYGNEQLETGYQDDYVIELAFTYDKGGNERVEVTLGDPKPGVDRPNNRRATPENDWGGPLFWYRSIEHTRLYPAASDDVAVYSGNKIQAFSGVGTGLTAQIDGATGRIDSVDGYTKSGAAANRHVLIGDGTRGVFRALVAADLPAVSNIWTKVAANVYTTTANDCIIPNSGTGTIGLTADRWDYGYFENLAVTTSIVMSNGAAITTAAGPIVTFDDTNNRLTVTGAHLRVGYDTDLASYLGNAAIGFCGFGDLASFAHLDSNNTGGYALIQTSVGATGLNTATGQVISFGINNAARMVMSVTATMLYSGQDLEVHSGAGGSLVASIDGATGRIDSVDGYTKSGSAANRHVLIGDGTRGVFRALVAADLPAIGANWTDTGAFLHPTAVRDVKGDGGANPGWELFAAGGAHFYGANHTYVQIDAAANKEVGIQLAQAGVVRWTFLSELAGTYLGFYDNVNARTPLLIERATGNVHIRHAGDLLVYDGAPGNLKASIDGATGNLWLATAATTGFGGLTYTWPAAQTANYYLKTNGAGALSWVNPYSDHNHDHGGLAGLADDDHPQYLTPAEHTAIGSGAPHHAAVTLGVGSAAELTLAGQALTLAEVLTPAEHTAIGNAAPHHAAITLDANADTLLSLTTQALGLDTQTANLVFSGPAAGVAAVPTFRALVAADLPGGLVSYWNRVPGTVFPLWDNDCVVKSTTGTIGIAGSRWDNIYSVLGNFSGTLTTSALLPAASNTWDIGVTGTRYRDLWLTRNLDMDGALDVLGNIVVGGTVDGVDIAAFKTAYDAHYHNVTAWANTYIVEHKHNIIAQCFNTGAASAGTAHTHNVSVPAQYSQLDVAHLGAASSVLLYAKATQVGTPA
uniref:Uncharacterized protein n=2 Tax=viral metagenome TaxID=1070528 RepID=A0A6H1ZC31_9ZZZZ